MNLSFSKAINEADNEAGRLARRPAPFERISSTSFDPPSVRFLNTGSRSGDIYSPCSNFEHLEDGCGCRMGGIIAAMLGQPIIIGPRD